MLFKIDNAPALVLEYARIESDCFSGRHVTSFLLLSFVCRIAFFTYFYASRRFLYSLFFLVFVFPTGCVRVNSSVGDGLSGFRLLLTYGCSLEELFRAARVEGG